ncbi:MAG: YebC/PmpR family DNA-binding transcriptional regulator [Candidatus Pacebacteria bacterium]|nr:YebC/PmpR family DNA-binding transcriptional regulator [Candidatus Paceibacterota bacterium]
MSGHSHYSTIKHKKGIADAQRGKIFSKMARLITIAAKHGGNPDENPKLREVIEKAKSVNMPSTNVQRAIKRGTGELLGIELQEMIFEAYGPGNIAIVIEGITDNTNRSVAEIKHILNKYDGKLANEGAVTWLFNRKGILVIDSEKQTARNKEELELEIIDAGADDFQWQDKELLEVYTSINNLENLKEKLQKKEIKIESSILGWLAKEEIAISDKEKRLTQKLFEELSENESVQEIYSNLKI